MNFLCSRCLTNYKFSSDKAAEACGHKIIAFRVQDNERYTNCPQCLHIINENRDLILKKHQPNKIIYPTFPKTVIPARQPDKQPTKNENMFESISSY
jgi:hypothetical protein